MLLPTRREYRCSFICLVLGLLGFYCADLCSCSVTFSVPLPLFESCHWNICILHKDTRLVILQGQHWETLDLSEVQANSQI